MKKLVLKSLLMLCTSMGVVFYIIFLTPLDNSKYLGVMHDKIRLITHIDSPRIILVGGSNLTFGIDSLKIEENFSRNVINMGLSGGIGLRFQLNLIKEHLKPDDVIVLCPEYHYFFSERDGLNGNTAMLEALIFYPNAFRYVSPKQYTTLIKSVPYVVQRRAQGLKRDLIRMVKGLSGSTNRHTEFNHYGDMIGHREKELDETIRGDMKFPTDRDDYSEGVLRELNKFYRHCTNMGVQVYITFPHVPDILIDRDDRRGFSVFTEYVEDGLLIPRLDTPYRLKTLPKEYFFKTVYHLNDRGIMRNTATIIDELFTVIDIHDRQHRLNYLNNFSRTGVLLSWEHSECTDLTETQYNGNQILTAELRTRGSSQMKSHLIDIHDGESYHFQCLLRASAPQGVRTIRLACYDDEKQQTFPGVYYDVDKELEPVDVDTPVYTIYSDTAYGDWIDVSAFIVGHDVDVALLTADPEWEECKVIKTSFETKFFRIIFGNSDNGGQQNSALFYDPRLHRLDLE
jgi:hypothetical protein